MPCSKRMYQPQPSASDLGPPSHLQHPQATLTLSPPHLEIEAVSCRIKGHIVLQQQVTRGVHGEAAEE